MDPVSSYQRWLEGNSRNHDLERAAMDFIRRQDDQTKMELVEGLISVRVDIGIQAVVRCQMPPGYLERKLRWVVLNTDVSMVGNWMRAITPRLPATTVDRILKEIGEDDSAKEAAARYWLGPG
jgi:hypothetical protein